MYYGVTYTDDVEDLTARGLALCAEGKYQHLMGAVSVDRDNDGVSDGIQLFMKKVHTAYHPTYPAKKSSLCFIKLTLAEFTEAGNFCDEVGLALLAVGQNRGRGEGLNKCPYDQINDGIGNEYLDPDAKVIYESVLPPVDILDADGNPTGATRFNKYTEFAIS